MKLIEVNCKNCGIEFKKKPAEVKRRPNHFCSSECFVIYTDKSKKQNTVTCKQCSTEFYKSPYEQRNTKNNFCSRSCAATYNNTHKTHGTRVSKLEIFLQEELSKKYSYEFHFNRKDAINSELDIYIPELKLAFELNGIFHYEPIYGPEKLNQIQNNDSRKFQACLEKEISLCIIDTSWIKNNTLSKMNKILEIVEEVIGKGGGGI